MDVFLAALAGAFGAGGLILVARIVIPLLERVWSSYTGVKHTIDKDRDRIVVNLRSEVHDLDRQLQRERAEVGRLRTLLTVAEKEIGELRERVDILEDVLRGKT